MASMLGAQLKNKAPWTPYRTPTQPGPNSRPAGDAQRWEVQIDAQRGAFMVALQAPVTGQRNVMMKP